MPTPSPAMAQLAAMLSDVDAGDEQQVEDFYVSVFPAFSERIREEIFGWLSSLDVEPAADELEKFASKMRGRRDFAVQRSHIVSGDDVSVSASDDDHTGAIASPI